MENEQNALASCIAGILNDLYAFSVADDFFTHVLRTLRRYLPMRSALCIRVQVAERTSGVVAAIGAGGADAILARAGEWEEQNPFLPHCCSNAAGPVLAITDIMPEEEWRRSVFFTGFASGIGGDHCTSVRFYEGGVCYCFLINDVVPADARSRALLGLVVPHLRRAAEWYGMQRAASPYAAYHNLIMLDAGGILTQCGNDALQMLRHYFPQSSGSDGGVQANVEHPKPAEGESNPRECAKGAGLPEEVYEWLRAQSRRAVGAKRFEVRQLQRERGGVMVVLTALPSFSAGIALVVEEKQTVCGTDSLLRLGLSVREVDVLKWVCEGKQNREIAIILGISVKTVSRHLESIFEKLGCENRHAAMRIGWEAVAAPVGHDLTAECDWA